MPVWIQLMRSKQLNMGGQTRAYQPGDWVKLGKQVALAWLADGSAIDPFGKLSEIYEPPGSVGVMGFGKGRIPELNSVPVAHEGSFELRWEKTLFLDLSTPINKALIPVGFKLLSTWQLAVPLVDYRRLARDEGDEDERRKTLAVIHDLRVPVYDIRCIFARRCEENERLFDMYEAEGGNSRLAFLRALYTVKPLILALPVTWTGQWCPTEA